MVEHEMKFAAQALEPIRQALRLAGAHQDRPPAFEDNLVLDNAEQRLRTSGRLLRVRRWGESWSVTLKGAASFCGGIKSRPEQETDLTDGRVLLTILAELGYTPVRRYQKRREVWGLQGATVALDETPMGCFVELEGNPEDLPRLAWSLSLDPAEAVPCTYLELWNRYRETHPDAPAEMLFP